MATMEATLKTCLIELREEKITGRKARVSLCRRRPCAYQSLTRPPTAARRRLCRVAACQRTRAEVPGRADEAGS